MVLEQEELWRLDKEVKTDYKASDLDSEQEEELWRLETEAATQDLLCRRIANKSCSTPATSPHKVSSNMMPVLEHCDEDNKVSDKSLQSSQRKKKCLSPSNHY